MKRISNMSGSLGDGGVESIPIALPWWNGPSSNFGGEFPVWIWLTDPVNPDHVILSQFLVIAEPESPSFLDISPFCR